MSYLPRLPRHRRQRFPASRAHFLERAFGRASVQQTRLVSATRVPDVREQLPVCVVRCHVHVGAIHRRVFPVEAQCRVYRESGEARRHIAVGVGARRVLLCPVHVRSR